jgi:hypothetical protein
VFSEAPSKGGDMAHHSRLRGEGLIGLRITSSTQHSQGRHGLITTILYPRQDSTMVEVENFEISLM